MSTQMQLPIEKSENQSTDTTVEEHPIAFKALRTLQTTNHDKTILQEAKNKTEKIREIAEAHPDIIIRSGTLPPGYIVSYHLKGGSIMSKHVSETEFIQKIKRAIPKEIRNKHDYFRGVITRELDRYTVCVGPNFRFCPIKNIDDIVKLFEISKTEGMGKQNISIASVIDGLLENKDIINTHAEELGIIERIENKEQLVKKIRFIPLIFDMSFNSPVMGIDSQAVSKIKVEMENEFKAEIEGDLKNRMQKVLKTLSASITTVKNNKGKTLHKRTHKALMHNLMEIENLNITESEEIKNMINLSKALTEALSTQDKYIPKTTTGDLTMTTPEEIFAEAFRKTAPVNGTSKEDVSLSKTIEELIAQF